METNRITSIDGINNLWKVDNLYLAGQPSIDSLNSIKDLGVSSIINLRGESEMDFSEEKAKSISLGLNYHQFPIVVDGKLNKENCEKLSNMINDSDPHFIHCGSANRVGGWLITYLVQFRNFSFEDAVTIAQNNGLSNPAFIDQAKEIINS